MLFFALLSLLVALALFGSLRAAGDRQNFSGDMSFTAPGGGYTRGNVYQLGTGAYAVARETKLVGEQCLMAVINDQAVEGNKSAIASSAVVKGGKVYVNASNLFTGNPTGGVLVGIALEAVADAGTTCIVVGSGLAPTAT
jgi:hypothetical protein